MRIHLTSYLLGIGTVVGALTVGFGGGVVLTHTAMKASPSGPARVERPAAELATPAATSATVAQDTSTPAATNPVRPSDSQIAGQDRPVRDIAISPAAAPPPQAAAASPPDPAARGVTPAQSERVRDVAAGPEQGRDPRPIKAESDELQQREQAERADIRSAQARDQSRRAEHSRRRAERQRRYYVVREPVREEIVSNSAEPRPADFFGGFFGRPAGGND
jgi:hypothetical protein